MTDADLLRRFRDAFGLTLDEVESPWGLSKDTWERVERGEVVRKPGVPVVLASIRSLMRMIDEEVPEGERHKWAARPLHNGQTPRQLVMQAGGMNYLRWYLSGEQGGT